MIIKRFQSHFKVDAFLVDLLVDLHPLCLKIFDLIQTNHKLVFQPNDYTSSSRINFVYKLTDSEPNCEIEKHESLRLTNRFWQFYTIEGPGLLTSVNHGSGRVI